MQQSHESHGTFGFLKDFAQKKILVAGEVGIDEYLWGDCRRISPEAPVPVVEVDERSFRLGLAGNVAQNVIQLGASATLVSLCGKDSDQELLRELLDNHKVTSVVLLEDASRPTLRKVRIIAQKQHVVRVDFEKSHPVVGRLSEQWTEVLENLLESHDAVILQDYGKGIWNTSTVAFMKKARALGKPVFVDPSRSARASLYQHARLLSPNLLEADALCGLGLLPVRDVHKDEGKLREMGRALLRATDAQDVVITCGAAGMFALNGITQESIGMPTFARDVYDVTGAGDTVIAALTLCVLAGLPLADCMQVANAAAGLTVATIGTAAITVGELEAELRRLSPLSLASHPAGRNPSSAGNPILSSPLADRLTVGQ